MASDTGIPSAYELAQPFADSDVLDDYDLSGVESANKRYARFYIDDGDPNHEWEVVVRRVNK